MYDTTGYTIASINARTYVNGSQLWRSINFRIPNDSTRSIDFYPISDSEINLGTSSNKWNNVYANTFNGNLIGNVTGNVTGNADTATKATTANSAAKATQDSDGNQINTTYSKIGHTHDDRYYTETEVNNLLGGKANTSGTYGDLTVGNADTANTLRTSDGDHRIFLDWSSQVSGYVGITVDSTKMGGIVTTNNLPTLLGGIGVYDIGSTVLATTNIALSYGETTAGSNLKYASLDGSDGSYNVNNSIEATGTWIKVSGNSNITNGFGLYRRIA